MDRARRRSPAEESRTLLASTNVAALGTLSDDGIPWASLVAFACLEDGAAALMVSTLAEHGRNLERDARASLMIAHPAQELDQLAHGRVTIAGSAEAAEGDRRDEARAAYLKAIPAANAYERFGDFRIWVLRPERVRWVGGYGRMDDVTVVDLADAEPDPTATAAARAVSHLNDDHADALLDMARSLAGYPDALAARCTGIDRYGLACHRDAARSRTGAGRLRRAGGSPGRPPRRDGRSRQAGSLLSLLPPGSDKGPDASRRWGPCRCPAGIGSREGVMTRRLLGGDGHLRLGLLVDAVCGEDQ